MYVLSGYFIFSFVKLRVVHEVVDGKNFRSRDVELGKVDLLVHTMILELLKDTLEIRKNQMKAFDHQLITPCLVKENGR